MKFVFRFFIFYQYMALWLRMHFVCDYDCTFFVTQVILGSIGHWLFSLFKQFWVLHKLNLQQMNPGISCLDVALVSHWWSQKLTGQRIYVRKFMVKIWSLQKGVGYLLSLELLRRVFLHLTSAMLTTLQSHLSSVLAATIFIAISPFNSDQLNQGVSILMEL